jgi:flagellar protein FlgJ
MPESAKDFVTQVWPHAVEASRSTGIPPQFLVAHSALESGWGKSEIRRPDGSGAHNLFGIKAGKNWTGDTVDTVTTEYIDGKPQQVVEKFRAYGSYAEAFRDYASLLRNNPRYGGVIGSQDGTEFARQLQQAGYATDPMYADKLSRIINGPTLRQALIG